MKYTISLQKIASALFIIAIFIYVSIIAQGIIVPFIFGALFAFLLKPICERLEKFIRWRGLASLLSFFLVLFPLFLVFFLFSIQLKNIIENLPQIGETLLKGFNNIFSWFNQKIGFTESSSQEWMNENASNLLKAPISFIGQGISSSTVFLSNTLLCVFYTYFLLLYRSSIKKFILIQVVEKRREKVEQLLNTIQKVIQKYLVGLGIVVMVLGTANSLGLLLIGLDYAIFWGFLAAFLAIIPYVGTLIGGLLPFLYALATCSTYFQPFFVVVLFTIVQTLEGNIITPKIVGSSVKINPLAAILSLVIGGFIWGVAGLILALPTLAVLRVIMSQIDFLKPLSLLLSDDIYGDEEVFEEKYDSERFRFSNFFKRKKNI